MKTLILLLITINLQAQWTPQKARIVRTQQDIGIPVLLSGTLIMLAGVQNAESWYIDGELNLTEQLLLTGFGLIAAGGLLCESEIPFDWKVEGTIDPFYPFYWQAQLNAYINRFNWSVYLENYQVKEFWSYGLGAGYIFAFDRFSTFEAGGQVGISNNTPAFGIYNKQFFGRRRIKLIFQERFCVNSLDYYIDFRFGTNINLIK